MPKGRAGPGARAVAFEDAHRLAPKSPSAIVDGRKRMVSGDLACVLVCLSLGLAAASCSASHEASPAPSTQRGGMGSADATTDEDAPGDAEQRPTPRSRSTRPAALRTPPRGDGGRDYSTDRGTFFGASRCADAGVQLCEDFESGMIDPSIWTVSGTTPVVDTHAGRARHSRAAHHPARQRPLVHRGDDRPSPRPNDTYFGRVFVYFKSLPADARADGRA